MTMGEGLGSRVVLHEGCSALSGPYVVEECDGDGGTRIRRLVFLNSPSVSQTEVKIIQGICNSFIELCKTRACYNVECYYSGLIL